METVRFSQIPGNTEAKTALRHAVDSGRIPHALMLSGPPGIGKMLMARAFMAYAHCESPVDGEPCGHCRNCRLHADADHPDVHFSFPIVQNKSKGVLSCDDQKEAWHRMLEEAPAMPFEYWLELLDCGNSQPGIQVGEAQEILRSAAFPPYATHLKFYVVWLPERMNLEAANKLLKVVEEPAQGICFLLVSDNELEVLPTIFSRTQRIRMTPVDRQDIERYLTQRWGMDATAAARLAPLAGGSLARADELGSNQGETEEFRRIFQAVMRSSYSRKVGMLKQLADEVAAFGREKTIRFLGYVSQMIRENFIYNLRMPQLNRLTPEDEAFSRNFSPFINAGNVEQMMEETDRARRETARNCNARIVLFDYFLLITGLIRKKPNPS